MSTSVADAFERLQDEPVIRRSFKKIALIVVALLTISGALVITAVHPSAAGLRSTAMSTAFKARNSADKAVDAALKIVTRKKFRGSDAAADVKGLANLVKAAAKIDVAVKKLATQSETATGADVAKIAATEKALEKKKTSIEVAIDATVVSVEKDTAQAHGHPRILRHGVPASKENRQIHSLAHQLSALSFAVDAANHVIEEEGAMIKRLPDGSGPDKISAEAKIAKKASKVVHLEQLQANIVEQIKAIATGDEKMLKTAEMKHAALKAARKEKKERRNAKKKGGNNKKKGGTKKSWWPFSRRMLRGV